MTSEKKFTVAKSTLLILSASAALLIIATAVQAKPFQHEFGELRQYNKHWLAVCPNAHKPSQEMSYNSTCWASTFTGENGSFSGPFPGSRLSVARNRTSGKFQVTMTGPLPTELNTAQPMKIRFSNGKAMSLKYRTDFVTNSNVINEYTFPDQALTKDFLGNLKAANNVTITLSTKEGEIQKFYSAIGITSAVKFITKYADR